MESKKKFQPDPNLKLMDQVREVLRYYHYAYRTGILPVTMGWKPMPHRRPIRIRQ